MPDAREKQAYHAMQNRNGCQDTYMMADSGLLASDNAAGPQSTAVRTRPKSREEQAYHPMQNKHGCLDTSMLADSGLLAEGNSAVPQRAAMRARRIVKTST